MYLHDAREYAKQFPHPLQMQCSALLMGKALLVQRWCEEDMKEVLKECVVDWEIKRDIAAEKVRVQHVTECKNHVSAIFPMDPCSSKGHDHPTATSTQLDPQPSMSHQHIADPPSSEKPTAKEPTNDDVEEAKEAKKGQKRKLGSPPAIKVNEKRARFMEPRDSREELSWWQDLFKYA
jgi:hypothetical protein